jgi:hypothetical protein
MLKFRKMTWVFLAWNILMLVWLVSGVAGVEQCSPGDSACEVGTAIGAGIGIALIGFVWFIGFIVLSILWFMTKPSGKSDS